MSQEEKGWKEVRSWGERVEEGGVEKSEMARRRAERT